MRFAQPDLFYLFGIVPIIVIIFIIKESKKQKLLTRLGNSELLKRYIPSNLKGSIRTPGIFFVLCLIFLIFALSRPQAGLKPEPVTIKGSDVLLAIDLSWSMNAEDIRPSRFERAKLDAREIINSLQGDRVGLIFFAGRAFVQCPMTGDYEAIKSMLKSVGRSSAHGSGTKIAPLLKTIMESFKPEEEKYSMVIIFSDGEFLEDIPLKLLNKIGNRGIKIFTVGIGTNEGAPIPIYNEEGTRTGYKKDKNGKIIISRLHDETLRLISEKTGGYYIPATNDFLETRKLLYTIESMKKRELEKKRYTIYEERFYIPLVFAIIFLFLYIYIDNRQRIWKERQE
ncbi:MAG: hypothetical protein DRP54_00465 [Spirochaetes bacterium]|nr:MAG: hypothetical protein DRP54_00465 [Spirochaetota bacterium]